MKLRDHSLQLLSRADSTATPVHLCTQPLSLHDMHLYRASCNGPAGAPPCTRLRRNPHLAAPARINKKLHKTKMLQSASVTIAASVIGIIIMIIIIVMIISIMISNIITILSCQHHSFDTNTHSVQRSRLQREQGGRQPNRPVSGPRTPTFYTLMLLFRQCVCNMLLGRYISSICAGEEWLAGYRNKPEHEAKRLKNARAFRS